MFIIKVSKWTKRVLKELISIQDKKPEDRLEFIEAIAQANNAIVASGIGWSEWIKKPAIMKEFNIDELKEIHKGFQDIACKVLTYDIKWTKVMAKRFKGGKSLKAVENLIEEVENKFESVNEIDTDNINKDNTSYIS